MSAMSPSSPVRARLSTLLRVAVAVVILCWIATTLPWQDELRVYTGEKSFDGIQGEIVEGDWKNDAIRFRVTEASELGPTWPEHARAAAQRGEAFAVVRREGRNPGLDWQPSMLRAFRDMEIEGLASAMGLFFVAALLVSTRWWRLLKAAGCQTSWFNAFRLTNIGFCFNLVMPGMTGGDLVKGVLVIKENPRRRADALMSVIVDRAVGMVALALLAVTATLCAGGSFLPLRTPLLLLLGACVLAVALYVNKPLRRMVGVSALVDRLPLGEKLRALDRAALLYLQHPGELALAFFLSVANHLVVCGGVFALARAVGVDSGQAGLLDFIVLASVANMVSALPVAPGGWGLGEFIYKELFEMIHLSGALGVAVSVVFRLCMIVGLGAIGSLFLLVPGTRAEIRESNAVPARE